MKKNMKLLLIPCTAAALTLGSAMISFAATGWAEENGQWVYYNNDGSKATNVFKKSGNGWFYLDEDGYMAKSQIVEVDDNYYYVNSAGAMVSNEWREVENEDSGDGEPDTWWYYLQANGKAVKKSGSSDSVRTATLPTAAGNAKFIFDEEGHMMSGWIDENGEMLTDDDARQEGLYYCGLEDGGRMATGWKYLEAEPEEDDDDREGDGYYFYFNPNGKKVKDTESKKINGRKYRFNEHGVAEFDWYAKPGTETASSSNLYYSAEDQCWLSTGWFKTVPSEDVDPEAHNDDEPYWFYANSNGELAAGEIKTIKGQKYGFDPVGKMLHGLYKITFDEDGRTILEAEEIESESDLPDEDEDVSVYYFGDSPKEGAMKTGTATLDIDGEKHYYKFKSSGSDKGAGVDKIDDGSIYIKGKRVEAEEGSKYEDIEYKGEHYLISTSGKIMKSKKNIKDSDDTYYCTDSKGIITYKGSEKKD